MPRYYFDISDGDQSDRDDEGIELVDLRAMRAEAFRILPQLARDRVPQETIRTYLSKVRDESGRIVFAATMTMVATWFVTPPD